MPAAQNVHSLYMGVRSPPGGGDVAQCLLVIKIEPLLYTVIKFQVVNQYILSLLPI